MAEDIKKQQQEKDSSAGLGTLIGFGALAALPFLRPFRNISGVKRALSTLAEKNASRTTDTQKLLPLIRKQGEGITTLPTKVKYQVQVKPQTMDMNPLVNDRKGDFMAQRLLPFAERDVPKTEFGSALYDQIKMFPKDKATADDWIKYFKAKTNTKYNDGRSSSINTEELFDSNIAALDKSGFLVGGLLKNAKDLNMVIDKNTLLKQVYKNPFFNLEYRRFTTPTGLDEAAGGITSQISKVKELLHSKYTQDPTTKGTAYASLETLQGLDNTYKSIFSNFGSADKKTILESLKLNRTKVKKELESLQTLLTDPEDKRLVTNVIKDINKLSEDVAIKYQAAGRTPVHATSSEYGTYRLEGEMNPGEFVWRFKDRPIAQSTVDPKSYDHIFNRQHKFGEFPVVHGMYGTRVTPKGEKVLTINEIQSDMNSKVLDEVSRGKIRLNPYGKEEFTKLAADPLNTNRARMEELLKKGIFRTEEEAYELNKIFGQMRAARNVLGQKPNYIQEALTEYVPFYNNKNYADLAVKSVIKEGGDQGAQWVGVVPVDRLSRQTEAVAGQQQFYGYATGKGFQKKGTAVVPEVMKKLANQYNTEAKTIQVSLSDPKKPWKLVRDRQVRRYDGTRGNPGNSVETFKTTVHKGAYNSREEALRAAESMSSNVEVAYIPEGDPNLYMNVYALRISPDMINKPMKIYRNEGGLIENPFRPL